MCLYVCVCTSCVCMCVGVCASFLGARCADSEAGEAKLPDQHSELSTLRPDALAVRRPPHHHLCCRSKSCTHTHARTHTHAQKYICIDKIQMFMTTFASALLKTPLLPVCPRPMWSTCRLWRTSSSRGGKGSCSPSLLRAQSITAISDQQLLIYFTHSRLWKKNHIYTA